MSVFEPSDRSITTWRSRHFFLAMVRQDAPEVLEELRGVPLACYRAALDENRWLLDDRYAGTRLSEVFDDEAYLRRGHSIHDLRDSLQFWGETFHLTDSWCLERAFKTIEVWYKHPHREQQRMWAREAVGYWPAVSEEDGRFSFAYERWDSVSQDREAYQQAVEIAFRRHLGSYCDWVESLTHERGYIEQKLKRDLTHFQWLVWYQVKNYSQSQVGNKFNAARTTVADGIKDAAAMCGLTLRQPEGRGRPRKS